MIYLKLTSQLKLLMDLHGALVASRPPHCHRNSTDHIKSFNRSIEIFPSGSLILLILPALTQTLFGNLWAFPHHRGKVRVQKKGKRKKKRDPMFKAELIPREEHRHLSSNNYRGKHSQPKLSSKPPHDQGPVMLSQARR